MAGELISQISPDLLASFAADAQLHADILAQRLSTDGAFDFAKNNSGTLVKAGIAAGALAAAITGPLKVFDNVPQGHYGYRARGGRLQRKHGNILIGAKKGDRYGFVDEGPHMHPPLVGGFETIGTQDRVTSLGEFHIIGGDERKQKVEAELVWGVVSPYDAEGNLIENWRVEKRDTKNPEKTVVFHLDHKELIFRALTKALNNDELTQFVKGTGKETLRLIMRKEQAPADCNGQALLPKVHAICGNVLLRDCGVELRGLNIVDAAPTEGDTIAFAYRRGVEPDPDEMPRPGVVAAAVPDLRILHASDEN